MRKRNAIASAISLLLVVSALPVQAGISVYKDGPRYVKIGGRIQLQYHRKDPSAGTATDDVFFRRFRPYIEGSLYPDWKGKFQFDLGSATDSNEVAIKDAYMQYKGWDNIKVTVGNANFPFSRELLTSSKKQQLVERTFVGDHNYGTPDRNLGIHVTGHSSNKHITWGASAAAADIDPDYNKLDFDTPVNKNSDFNQGWIIGGRIDFHPFGRLKMSQGDFNGETRATIGVGAFSWINDDDNNTHTTAGVDDGTKKPDVDNVQGVEVSGAFRSSGFSVDAEYNRFDADTVAAGLTGGIYKSGTTTLRNWSIEGGYMVLPGQLEIVVGRQQQDADNYASQWTRTSIGANWFVKKHDIKYQLSYRMGDNLKGISGSDEDEVFLQAQYVF